MEFKTHTLLHNGSEIITSEAMLVHLSGPKELTSVRTMNDTRQCRPTLRTDVVSDMVRLQRACFWDQKRFDVGFDKPVDTPGRSEKAAVILTAFRRLPAQVYGHRRVVVVNSSVVSDSG